MYMVVRQPSTSLRSAFEQTSLKYKHRPLIPELELARLSVHTFGALTSQTLPASQANPVCQSPRTYKIKYHVFVKLFETVSAFCSCYLF